MIFYRYELIHYATIDQEYYGRPIPKSPVLRYIELNLHKETPKGYWIGYGTLNVLHSYSKWVSKNIKKTICIPY